MSLLLRGMKMPKVGQNIEISRGISADDIYARLTPSLEDEWHKVIELPEKHGRLIEEPKVFYYGGLVHIGCYDFEGIAKYFYEQVKEQPTILESEGME